MQGSQMGMCSAGERKLKFMGLGAVRGEQAEVQW